MNNNDENEAGLIEQDIRHTQDAIGETVQKLEEQLAPRQVVRSVVGDDRVELFEEAIELVRRNPVPTALILVGAIWLLAKSRSSGPDLIARFSSNTSGARVDPAPVNLADPVRRQVYVDQRRA
jgi:hypothetical protein